MHTFGYILSNLVEDAGRLRQVRKTDLASGDRIYVKTANSVYSIRIVSDRRCELFMRTGLC